MEIRESTALDLPGLLKVEEEAFGETEGPVIVTLVKELLEDWTAKPLRSFIALQDQQVIGHILFTKASVTGHETVKTAILAPLAVKPGFQKRGVGGNLVKEGLRRLAEDGVKVVFVLGHPKYYPRFGFEPAVRHGLKAPYPIPEAVEDAWMVQELSPGSLSRISGLVRCAEAMDHPEHWAE